MRAVGRAVRGLVSGMAAWRGSPSARAADGPVSMDPVVVTATRIEEKVSEQASSVSVVERDDDRAEIPRPGGGRPPGASGRERPALRQPGQPGEHQDPRGLGDRHPRADRRVPGEQPDPRRVRHQLPAGGALRAGGGRPGGPERAVRLQRHVRGGELPSAVAGGRARGSGRASPRGAFRRFQWNGFAEGGGKDGSFHMGGTGFSSEGIHENDDTTLASFLGGGDVRVGDRSRFHFLVMATDSMKEVPIDFGTPRDDDHRWERQGFLAGGRWETRFSPVLSITASGERLRREFPRKGCRRSRRAVPVRLRGRDEDPEDRRWGSRRA